MSPPHCHPGREWVRLWVCPHPQPQLLQGPPFPAHPVSPENWMPEPGLALQSPQPILGSVMPLTVLWVLQDEEGHVASLTPPAVSMKGNSKERGININELICTEKLSLIPQPDSTQKEG